MNRLRFLGLLFGLGGLAKAQMTDQERNGVVKALEGIQWFLNYQPNNGQCPIPTCRTMHEPYKRKRWTNIQPCPEPLSQKWCGVPGEFYEPEERFVACERCGVVFRQKAEEDVTK